MFNSRPTVVNMIAIFAGNLLIGVLLSRNVQELKFLRAKIEESVKLNANPLQRVTVSGPTLVVPGPKIDVSVIQATRVLRGNDMVYIPVCTILNGIVQTLIPPPQERLTMLEMLEQHYDKCKMNSLLESALIVDLTVLMPGSHRLMKVEDYHNMAVH